MGINIESSFYIIMSVGAGTVMSFKSISYRCRCLLSLPLPDFAVDIELSDPLIPSKPDWIKFSWSHFLHSWRTRMVCQSTVVMNDAESMVKVLVDQS